MKTILLLLFFTFMISGTIYGQTPKIEPGVSQELAKWRAGNYSDIWYKLNITLEKGAPLMKGDIEIRVKLTEDGAKNDLILDWRTTQFANDKDKPFANVVAVNEANAMTGAQASRLPTAQSGVKPPEDQQVYSPASFSRSALNASGTLALRPLALQSNEHLIIPSKLLKTGENVIKIEFASPIKTSGAAVTRYVDKEDGAEYVYSLFVPSDASTAFPVFDQPDLKARFTLNILAPREWKVISNSKTEEFRVKAITNNPRSYEDKQEIDQSKSWAKFLETKPISTYVFAFAAGEFVDLVEPSAIEVLKRQPGKNSAKFRPSGADLAKLQPPTTTDNFDLPRDDYLPMRIYVRKSQADKFKQHAAEVFRLNRESVKYLEDWFDYKFPFPKYDLVLIPEFPFGGMEHAGATFLREDRVIFPTEPTKNDYITRANVIFHEAAHQWFGDTVTMRWFDDLWLKEGFAEFMAYKTLEKLMPEYNAWKVFYERNKQAAYLTDVTRGTTPIYQEIPNLASAKSAYGNIVYRKAPSFLKQAEFYLGEKEFQTAVRAFLKKHEFANAEWTDLVKEFETASKQDLKDWSARWIKQRGSSLIKVQPKENKNGILTGYDLIQIDPLAESSGWNLKFNLYISFSNGTHEIVPISLDSVIPFGDIDKTTKENRITGATGIEITGASRKANFIFPNYQDYGYGIFLLDEKSRAYVLSNIQNEKDSFLRSMMWGSLWDSVRFYELAPEEYVRLVIKNINVEQDESTIATLLGRVSVAMNYYLSEPPAVAGGLNTANRNAKKNPSATADGSDLRDRVESLLINKIETAPTVGQKITYFRALQSIGSGEQTKRIFKDLLTGKSKMKNVELKTKDKFDLVTRLIILGDKDALNLLAKIEKEETGDAAQRYAYAARAGIPTAANKAKYWNDFVNNKEISENWIESAFAVFNTPRHSELTLPYLEKALAELPNLKRNRKIFFVNGWLGAFIGGQKSEEALKTVNKFLEKNPDLDRDLRLKILENMDNLERAVKIREKFGK